MALCTLATVPVLGIDALGLTPYLGAFSALQVPAPAWKWTTPVTAAVPVLSLLGGRLPGLLLHPGLADHRRLHDRAGADRGRDPGGRHPQLARAGRRARAGGPRRARRPRPLADRPVGEGRAGRPAHRRRPRRAPGPSWSRSRPPPARRSPRCARPSAACGPATSRPSSPRRRGCSPTPASTTTVTGDGRRHRPAAPGAAGLGAARVGHQRRTPRAGAVGGDRARTPRPQRHRRRRRRARARRATGCAACASGSPAPVARWRSPTATPGTRVEVVLP